MTRILVVDDTAMDRKLAEGLLRKIEGWVVESVTSAAEALERIPAFQPSLVLTDLQMPEMNGLQLVKHVHHDHPDLPVIVMTSRGSEAIAVEALETGAASYVPKRHLHRLLVNAVQRVLTSAEENETRRDLMHGLDYVSWKLTISNHPPVIASLVSFVQSEICRTALLPESECFRCGVAFEEALLNAAYHGNLEVSSKLREENPHDFYDLAELRNQTEPYKDRKISVTVLIDQTAIEYRIEDEGPGFDPAGIPDPTTEEFIDRPCGRGVLLMRTFMDEVNYNEKGNAVTMIKRSGRGLSAT